MTVAGVVMAHEKRRAFAEELADKLALPICWDRVQDRHETGLRCLQAGLDAAEHVTSWLVVQDDAIACADLLAGLEQATAVAGDRLIGLYVGNTSADMRARTERAQTAGCSWIACAGPKRPTLWGVGIVVPTVHLPDLLRFYERSSEVNYDRRIEHWAARAGVDCWYTVPSLVDHRHGDENPSLVPGRTSTSRHAARFIGADVSALSVDWARVPVTSGVWRNRKTLRVQRVAPGSPQAARFEQNGQWEPVVEVRCGECGSKHYTPAGATVPA